MNSYSQNYSYLFEALYVFTAILTFLSYFPGSSSVCGDSGLFTLLYITCKHNIQKTTKTRRHDCMNLTRKMFLFLQIWQIFSGQSLTNWRATITCLLAQTPTKLNLIVQDTSRRKLPKCLDHWHAVPIFCQLK